MENLLQAIRTTITRFVAAQTALTAPARTGDTVLTATSARRFGINDEIAIYQVPTDNQPTEAEIRRIVDVDGQQITINEPLSSNHDPAVIQKCHHGKFLRGVHLGNPSTLPGYPGITLELAQKTNSPLTLASTSEEYEVQIKVWADSIDHERSYLTMLHYASAIETSLWRSQHPLVPPYVALTLVEEVPSDDLLVRVSSTDTETLCAGRVVYLESADYHRTSMIAENLGNGVYRLTQAVGVLMPAGSKIIMPGRWFYVALPRQVESVTFDGPHGPLCAARLTYVLREERTRWSAGIADPLTM